jgi:hypothetical protein
MNFSNMKTAKKNAGATDDFLIGKTEEAIGLFNIFKDEFRKVGKVELHAAKTMIGVATSRKRIAYITQIGKNFIHVVFPFDKPYENSLCFHKVVQVPGKTKQFNHHFRMYAAEDLNREVIEFMRLAYEEGT